MKITNPMTEQGPSDSILKRISKMNESGDFDNFKISPEGYGTFFRQDPTKYPLLVKAMNLKEKAERINNKEAISLYFEAILLFLRANEDLYSNDIQSYLNLVKFTIKLLDHTINFVRSINEKIYLSSLEYALFNLKFFKTIKDSRFINDYKDSFAFKHTIDNLKFLDHHLYNHFKGSVEIVKPAELELGIRKRLPKELKLPHIDNFV